LASKTALLFPGQGAQSLGMGAELYATLPAAAQLFDRASEQLSYDLHELCVNGPAEELDSTIYSQPALYVSSLAALERLKIDSPETIETCVATAGLSLGEYTALTFAGALSFDDGLRVVAERGKAMQDAADRVSSGMVSILGLELDQIQRLCDEARDGEVLNVANHLCPGNIVVSGINSACERVAELASRAGAIRVIPLAVAGAFHTSLMEPAVERLRAVLAAVQFRSPRIPVVSNVDARSHSDPTEIRALLVKQVVSPVRWEESVRFLIAGLGVEQFCEVGPGRVLRGLLKRIDRLIPCESISA
jgi:[acyl-carrier-protein] S-malonyltransferase